MSEDGSTTAIGSVSGTRFSRFASVILDSAIDKTLDYGIPDQLLPILHAGSRVEIPLRGKLVRGTILELKDQPGFPKVSPIKGPVPNAPVLPPDLLKLAVWMAKYYCAPLSRVLNSILPGAVRKETGHKQQYFVMRKKSREEIANYLRENRGKSPVQERVLDAMIGVTKGILLTELMELADVSRSPIDTLAKQGWIDLDIVRIDRSPLVDEVYFKSPPKKLGPEQELAHEKITGSLRENRFETHLLFGITGSGKTEVYLQAIDFALKQGKGSIILVPEISLTPQTIERFRARFDDGIAILHHRLSTGERFDEWHRIQRGEAQIVIGARSAIFSPLKNLGLIIVDEEHEGSYKQTDESPCYHARDLAVMRGHITNSTVILGSATPSLESYHNALEGKYNLTTLPSRADSASRPLIKIVDMNRECDKVKRNTPFSELLLDAIQKRYPIGEKSILFLNRRGYHTTHLCTGCGEPIKCTDCDCALTYHKNDHTLACHLCGYQISPPPQICPHCGSRETLRYKGYGTEQIEKAIHAIFPDIRTLRMDADTTKHKGSHQKILRDFRTGKGDVLIGTQMIAKGLHFPDVTLVGVINADPALNIPDFRASETSFQLITQVAGRSGRGVLPGEVIIQTRMPQNPTILLASEENYLSFAQGELEVRKMFDYPPYSRMAKVTFVGKSEGDLLEGANRFRAALVGILSSHYEIHPILPGGYAKIKGMYRFNLLIKGPKAQAMSSAIDRAIHEVPLGSGIRLGVNIDPLSTYF